MEDFNALKGSDNSTAERTMERYGFGRLMERGKILLDACRTNNLIIGGTLFPHPRIHKVTWLSPESVTEN